MNKTQTKFINNKTEYNLFYSVKLYSVAVKNEIIYSNGGMNTTTTTKHSECLRI